MEADERTELRKKAIDSLRQGRPGQSVEWLNSILACQPDDDQSWAYLGAAYSKLKEWSLAVQAFQRVVELNPTFRAYHNLALALERSGRLDEAERAFTQAFDRYPTYEPAIEGLNRIRRGVAPVSFPSVPSISSVPSIHPEGVRTQSMKTGLVYGTGVGAVWHIAVFFFLQLFGLGLGDRLLQFSDSGKLIPLLLVLGVIGVAIGAAIGCGVGYLGGGTKTGCRVGAVAGMIAQPINTYVVAGNSARLLLISLGVGVVMGAVAGCIIGRLIELSLPHIDDERCQLESRPYS